MRSVLPATVPLRPFLPAALLLALVGPTGASDHVSTYTEHDYARCPKRSAVDDVVVHACPGRGGTTVTWTAGDDSSAVSFGGEAPALGSFFEAGRRIEWRGPRGAPPVAAILRYRVGPSVGRLDGSRLVVHRLGARGGCVVGIVDGARKRANEDARAIADERAPTFLCGRDRPLVRGARG